MTPSLFGADDLPQPAPSSQVDKPPLVAKPRLRTPTRDQVEMHLASLEQLLDPDHPARIVWDAVCRLDLSAWLGAIKAVQGSTGRDATDPRLLVSLWVLATLKGSGSARELDRLCRQHIAYQWLCGGVTVNYHLLSDFRSEGGDKWDELLTQLVGSLTAANLVTMDRVAQDGMKVRASAGRNSFRKQQRLEDFLEEARQQVKALKELAQEDGEDLSRRQRAARQRAASERQRRLEEALVACQELQQQREATAKKSCREVKEAKASTTDPEARVMKFADGGYRPGYNVQFATDTASGVIVGVEVTNAGTDNEQLPPMLDQLEKRYGCVPREALVDGGFASADAIDEAENRGCAVYAPLKEEEKQRAAGKDPYARKPRDTDAVACWRMRMGSEAAKLIYRLRCQVAEWVNAQCRNRGLWFMPVRSRRRCQNVGLLYAITHNLVTWERLRAEAAISAG